MTQRRVYLDVCALCRPFDDQSYIRIRMESDAVRLVLQYVRERRLQLVSSPVHHQEITAIPELLERTELLAILAGMAVPAALSDMLVLRTRAEYLVRQGAGVADAAHLAFAEAAEADFVTCDDRLLRVCRKVAVNVWCGTPTEFCCKEDLK
jgi:predicted nucleic acid-binding protein